MRGKIAIFQILFLIGSIESAVSEAYKVASPKEFSEVVEGLNPGDSVILKDGVWKDARLMIRRSGAVEKPLLIRSQTPGNVIFRGDSRISVAGDHVHLSGFQFQNPEGVECFETRIDSDEMANHCLISDCSVIERDGKHPEGKTARFVSLYGSQHRVERCYFAGKTTSGPTLVVWLTPGIAARHRIERNHFGPRPVLGRNGGETIRIGTSQNAMLRADCIVKSNLFEKCDGEAECISNKSCGNSYLNNFFQEVSGTLTLRHGNDCLVSGNVFEGNKAKGTGGVRVIGTGHSVTGNYFMRLRGDDERSALCIMLGIPDSPANGYFQVKNATITGNVFYDCKVNFLIGLAGDKTANLPPLDTLIQGNVIDTRNADAFLGMVPSSGVLMDRNETESATPLFLPKLESLDSVGPTWR